MIFEDVLCEELLATSGTLVQQILFILFHSKGVHLYFAEVKVLHVIAEVCSPLKVHPAEVAVGPECFLVFHPAVEMQTIFCQETFSTELTLEGEAVRWYLYLRLEGPVLHVSMDSLVVGAQL